MGFLFRLGFSMLLAWFLAPAVQTLISVSGVKLETGANSELIFGATTLVIYLLSRVFSSSPSASSVISSRGIRTTQGFSPASLPPSDAQQIKELLNGGKMIEAIKLIRSTGNLGLKEAKDLAEHLKVSGFQNISVRSGSFAMDDAGRHNTIDITNTEERIKKLNDLKDKGLVSESEYDERRKMILDEI